MGGQPLVYQLLDQAAPTERAPDEAPAALRLEVVHQAPVVGIALAALGDLGLDGLVGNLDALLVRDLRQHEERLDPLLGVRAEVGVEVGVGLLDDLEVGLLGDALASEARPELVVQHLDLLVDQHLGELDGGVRDRVLDDPVGELVARAVEGIAFEAVLDVCPERGEVLEVAQLTREVVVERRLDLLAQLLDLDGKVRLLALQRLLGIVVGERDVELRGAARLEPEQVALEARDEAFLADDQGHPVGGPALERLAVARSLERDDRVVTVLRATVFDGRQRRVLVAQLVDDLVDPGVVDDLDLGREVEVLVVAELDLRADLDRRLEDDRLALLGLDDLDVGVRQRQDRLVDERLAVGIVDEVLHRLFEDDAGPERALEHRPRRLARAKAGDARAAREPPDGVVDGTAQALRGELDLEHERAVGGGGGR